MANLVRRLYCRMFGHAIPMDDDRPTFPLHCERCGWMAPFSCFRGHWHRSLEMVRACNAYDWRP